MDWPDQAPCWPQGRGQPHWAPRGSKGHLFESEEGSHGGLNTHLLSKMSWLRGLSHPSHLGSVCTMP